MMQRIKKIIILFLSVGIVFGGFSGCLSAGEDAFDINSVSSYRDIPGITGEETDAIEALINTRESFSYASIVSTELFARDDGTYAGFQAGFCELLSGLFDIPFVIKTHETHEWADFKSTFVGMTVDFTGELTPTPERLQTYHMTAPVTQRKLSIITYGDAVNIETESDLNGLRIGFWEGTITAQSVLNAYPDLEFEIVPITGETDEIEMLRSGITDANVQEFVTTYVYEGIESVNITEAFPLVFTPISLSTANDELKPIISAVNKYIEAGGIDVLHELNRNGQNEYKQHTLRKLFTDEERAYIDSLDGKIPVVMGTDTYPVSFYDKPEGEFQGISMDILKEISGIIGIEFEVINEADASWGEILEMLRTGEAALISDLIITEERKEYFIWPQTPFFSTPYAFFSKTELPNLELYQIEQSDVGVVGWCATRDLYDQWFPNNSNTKLYNSQDEALDALEKNEIDLFFNLGYILNYQKEYREKPAYKANYTFPVFNDVFFGLNKNEEILCSIIDKSISHTDTDKIINDWANRYYDFARELAQSRFYFMLLIATALLLVLVIVITVYLRSVRNRKAAAEVEKRTKLMLDSNPLCCEIWDSNFNVIDCNEATVRFFGVGSKEEIISGIFNFSPEYQPDGQRSDEKVILTIEKAIAEGSHTFEWLHILLDGTQVPVEVTVVPIKYRNEDAVIAYTRDLREHVKMMAEIYEAEERLKLMLDASPLCCQLWHRDLKTIDCNEAAVKFYGFRDKQEYIDKFNTVCSPEYQPDGRRSDEMAQAFVEETFEDGYRIFEWTHQMPDGTPVPTEITLVRVSYKDDYIVAGYTRDLREYNKMMNEINYIQELMQTVNRAASILLAAEDIAEIESALLKSMELIGLATETDRVQIWQNETFEGVLRSVLKYDWLNESGKYEMPVPIGSVLDYNDKPGLESLFMSGGIINGSLSELKPEYRELLSEHNIKTIVFIPLFVKDRFWGLFSIDECTKERRFCENETNIFRSVSLMMAAAVDRHSLHLEILEAHSRTKILLDATPLCCQLWNRSLQKIDCNEETVRLFGFKDKADFLERYYLLYPEYQPDGRCSSEKARECAERAFAQGRITFEWIYQMFDGTLMPAEVTMVRIKHEGEYVLASYTRDLREHNRMIAEIKRRSELIDITNQVAFSLLSPSTEIDFEKSLINGLEMLGRYMDADRVQIWHNETRGGDLHYILNHEWLSDRVNKASPVPMGTALKYSSTWKELFLSGGHINEYVSKLEPEDRELMESLGLMSTVTIPLFSHGEFWGLLCVDDCLEARKFTEEDVSMLKSAGLMIVNSIIRIEQSSRIRKTNEQLISAVEQANIASKAKGDFLSTMSHEMRTPMNTIIGMTHIAKKTTDTEQKDHALSKIGIASSHLLGVINDVLDMAKIEANKLELAPVKFTFESMLQKVLAITNFRLDEKQQQLTVNVDKNIPRSLIGDDQRLAQVLTNLLSNAVKFTSERGKISLNVSFNSENNGNCELCIEVADNGIGISPEQIDKLFSPFVQTDSGINRKYGGTGLGLVITKRIVELMGGSIHVESEPDRGSRFTFTVNVLCSDKKDSPDDSTDSDNADGSADGVNFEGKKILVVEDMEINREILISLLDGMGFIIHCAENGKEALDIIEMFPDKYDVIFMDMQMPLMDGLEATRRIRALPVQRSQSIPIIAMTANVFKSDIEECLAAGMDDHLGKPIDIDSVLEKLRKYL